MRVSEVSPGVISTDFARSMTADATKAATQAQVDAVAITPDAIARGVAFAIEQPAEFDVGSIAIRSTAQG